MLGFYLKRKALLSSNSASFSMIDPSVQNSIIKTMNGGSICAIGDAVELALDVSKQKTLVSGVVTDSGWAAFGLPTLSASTSIDYSTTNVHSQTVSLHANIVGYGGGVEHGSFNVKTNEVYELIFNIKPLNTNSNGEILIDGGWHDTVVVTGMNMYNWQTLTMYFVSNVDMTGATVRFTLPSSQLTGEFYIEIVSFLKCAGRHLIQRDPAFKPVLAQDANGRYISFGAGAFMEELAVNPSVKRSLEITSNITGTSELLVTLTT